VDGGKVVDDKPSLPIEMWVDGRKVMAAQACDAMVHPQYRRIGVFRRLNELAIQVFDAKYSLFYSFPGPMALPFYLSRLAQSNGWRAILNVEEMFQVTNPQNVFSSKLGDKRMGNELGLLYSLFLGAAKKVFRDR
jgi:hypothetical protein